MLAAVLLLGSAPASASAYRIQWTGTFAAVASTTDYSAPGASFAFSFYLPDPFAIGPSDYGDLQTTQARDFTYSLNGLVDPLDLTAVAFSQRSFTDLVLVFGDHEGLGFGPGRDVYAGGGTLHSPLSGPYVVDQAVRDAGGVEIGLGYGSATLSVTTVTDIPGVPLPGSAPMLGAAVMLLGLVGRGLRRHAG